MPTFGGRTPAGIVIISSGHFSGILLIAAMRIRQSSCDPKYQTILWVKKET
jgi:hypothetical protein